MKPSHLDLFSGIGGFALAAQWAGFETVGFCEKDDFCRRVLSKHWPQVPILGDVKDVTIKSLRRVGVQHVDLITGGFPCQPFSGVGKRRGSDDNRHLWPEMFRIIQEVRPAWVCGENVPGIVNMALDGVCADLESEGYEVQPLIIPACAVNAPHERARVWIVAHAAPRQGQQRNGGVLDCPQQGGESRDHAAGSRRANVAAAQGVGYRQHSHQRSHEGREAFRANPPIGTERWRQVKPLLCRGDDGLSRRVDRLRSLGNAIVPEVAYEILQPIADVLLTAPPPGV